MLKSEPDAFEYIVDWSMVVAHMRSNIRWTLVAALVVEAIMLAVTAVATERYRSEAVVKLGNVEWRTEGAAGLILKRVSSELSSDGDLNLRPNNQQNVHVVGENDTAERALQLTQKAVDKLLVYSKEVVDLGLADRVSRVSHIATSLDTVENQLAALKAQIQISGRDHEVLNAFLGSEFKALLDSRQRLQDQLLNARQEMIGATVQPVALVKPTLPDRPFRPNWVRNIILGGVFGLVFGLFLTFLAAILKCARPRYAA